MAIYRQRHWTDTPHPSLNGQRRRKIGNHLNYVSPSGILLPVQSGVSQAAGAPPNWSGQFDFRDTNTESPLQFFAHDTTDSDNRAMIGVRVDSAPDVWINIKADGVNTGVETESPDSITRQWSELWTNSTLSWTHGGFKAEKKITLSAPGHPEHFDFLLKISPGSTLSVHDDIYELRDPQGDVKIQSRAPYGTGAGEDEYIRCTLSDLGSEGPGGQLRRVRLAYNADDLAAATYPIVLDPTTTISGTTAIDDAEIRSGTNADKTYGVSTSIVLFNDTRANLLRVDDSLIPAGTITSFSFVTYVGAVRTWETYTYKIKPVNAGWVEGTVTGTTETGSVCWNYLAYDASTPTAWAGGTNGCSVSGTDYVADASPPGSSGTDPPRFDPFSITLRTEWGEDWRDNPSNNAGHIHTWVSGNIPYYLSEETTYTPYYSVDYTVASGQPAFIRWTPTHVAGRNALFRGRF